MSGSSGFRNWLVNNKLVIDKNQYNGKVPFKAYVILVNHWCHRVILTISQIALIIMLCIVFFNVILRYCFNTGIGAVDEVARLLVTCFTFLACAIGVRDHMHISVTMLYNRFPKGGKMRKFMDVLPDISTLFCGGFFFYFGGSYMLRLMKLPGILPMTGLPTWIQYIAVPFAGFIMIFDSILFLIRVLNPDDLLYSEAEVDYGELMKQQAAEAAAAKGGKN